MGLSGLLSRLRLRVLDLALAPVVLGLRLLRRRPNATEVATAFARAGFSEVDARHWLWAVVLGKLSVALDATQPRGHLALALGYLRTGDPTRARRECDEVARLVLDDAWTCEVLGGLELELDRLPQAEATFRRTLGMRPRDPGVLAKLATALELQGRLEEAADALEQARELDPVNPSVLTALGEVRVRRGRATEGARLLTEAVRILPTLSRAHHCLAVALAGLAVAHRDADRWSEARRSARRAYELEPGNHDFERLLTSMNQPVDEFRVEGHIE